MSRKESRPEDLAACRDTRLAVRCLDQHERYLALLRHAQRLRQNNNRPDDLAPIIAAGQGELQGLRLRASGTIWPRRRPKHAESDQDSTCTFFIDECGTPSLAADDPFKAFVLAAVIIPDKDYSQIDQRWKRWKARHLGSANKVIHEPDLRLGKGPFDFAGDVTKRDRVAESIHKLIARLDFGAVSCVVNRPEYVAQVGNQRLDDSLPIHPYLMALDFLMERVVLALQGQFNCVTARVVAEARGPVEDAMLQYEYVRLRLEGTSYISPAWFRQQLGTAIEFKTKKENCTGLQLADLLARPCGEKVLNPSITPNRWPEFRSKLCQGKETLHSILGFKIVPWQDRYEDIWKS